MKKYNADFYLSMLKRELKEGNTMADFRNEKEVSELADGVYEAVLKRIFKNDLKQKPGYFLNIKLSINDEDYTYGQYVSERSVNFLYQNILLPLGMYCSEQGVLDCLKLRDLFVQFEKKSDERYTNIIFKPLYECKDIAPVGSKNACAKNPKNAYVKNENIVSSSNDDDMDEIPY